MATPAPFHVLHVAGHLTDAVVGTLGPISTALAERGIAQTLVYLSHDDEGALLERIHASTAVRPVMTGRVPFAGWPRLLVRARRELQEHFMAVHLHGLVPFALGWLFGGRKLRDCAVYFSPHGSRALYSSKRSGWFVLSALRLISRRHIQRTLVGLKHEGDALEPFTSDRVSLLESPVHGEFVRQGPREEAPYPLVVAAGFDTHASDLDTLSKAAVVLGHEVPGLVCEWHGDMDVAACGVVRASGISYQDGQEVTRRAQRLSQAWVFLTAREGRGFPHRLAEAMSLGVSCVAIDSPVTRTILRHGETGFLCGSDEQMLQQVAALLDSEELRRRIGRAARQEALWRFSDAVFRHTLLSLYLVERRSAPRSMSRHATLQP